MKLSEFLKPEELKQAKELVKKGEDIMDSPELFERLYEYFAFEVNEMPYGTMKARDGDPAQWIADRLEQEFKVQGSLKNSFNIAGHPTLKMTIDEGGTGFVGEISGTLDGKKVDVEYYYGFESPDANVRDLTIKIDGRELTETHENYDQICDQFEGLLNATPEVQEWESEAIKIADEAQSDDDSSE